MKGHNFFPRPEKGKATEAAWNADKEFLEREHRKLVAAVAKALRELHKDKFLFPLYGVAFHDVYHAGQIRLLRRLQRAD